MKYLGQSDYQHATVPRIGVLLTNLGTPEAPTAKALKPYLKQFLWDPRVVEVPRPIWWLILNGIILNTRPKRSAEAYSAVWNERGSPLLAHLEDQVAGVSAQLTSQHGDRFVVRGAMRYGSPAIADVLTEMFEAGVQKLVVLPLYPQYAASTTATVNDELFKWALDLRWQPAIRTAPPWHDHPAYIKALANSVRAAVKQHGTPDELVVSFHGIPKSYFVAGDPYHCHCMKTARLLREALKWDEAHFHPTFQSRFGSEPWLQPYTDKTVVKLAEDGAKHVMIMAPGFVADCLETLDELDIELHEEFLEHGGETFTYIPCLNDSAEGMQVIEAVAEANLAGWIDRPKSRK
mgnify:CR=1 FL=1